MYVKKVYHKRKLQTLVFFNLSLDPIKCYLEICDFFPLGA